MLVSCREYDYKETKYLNKFRKDEKEIIFTCYYKLMFFTCPLPSIKRTGSGYDKNCLSIQTGMCVGFAATSKENQ
jgi:hypothetical protein